MQRLVRETEKLRIIGLLEDSLRLRLGLLELDEAVLHTLRELGFHVPLVALDRLKEPTDLRARPLAGVLEFLSVVLQRGFEILDALLQFSLSLLVECFALRIASR